MQEEKVGGDGWGLQRANVCGRGAVYAENTVFRRVCGEEKA